MKRIGTFLDIDEPAIREALSDAGIAFEVFPVKLAPGNELLFIKPPAQFEVEVADEDRERAELLLASIREEAEAAATREALASEPPEDAANASRQVPLWAFAIVLLIGAIAFAFVFSSGRR